MTTFFLVIRRVDVVNRIACVAVNVRLQAS